MPLFANRTPLVVAILLNSLAFAVLHLSNDGIIVLAFINLVYLAYLLQCMYIF